MTTAWRLIRAVYETYCEHERGGCCGNTFLPLGHTRRVYEHPRRKQVVQPSTVPYCKKRQLVGQAYLCEWPSAHGRGQNPCRPQQQGEM